MVEKDKKKRAWLRERFPKVTIFKDMVDMAKKKAETHEGTFEVVPEVGGGKNTVLLICKKKYDGFVQKITTCLTSGRQTCSNNKFV